MSKQLYMGNLSFHTTADSIKEVLQAIGITPLDVSMPTDRETGQMRGFANVTVQDDQVQLAINNLNNTKVDGKVITVRAGQEKGAPSPTPTTSRGFGGGGGRGGGRSSGSDD